MPRRPNHSNSGTPLLAPTANLNCTSDTDAPKSKKSASIISQASTQLSVFRNGIFNPNERYKANLSTCRILGDLVEINSLQENEEIINTLASNYTKQEQTTGSSTASTNQAELIPAVQVNSIYANRSYFTNDSFSRLSHSSNSSNASTTSNSHVLDQSPSYPSLSEFDDSSTSKKRPLKIALRFLSDDLPASFIKELKRKKRKKSTSIENSYDSSVNQVKFKTLEFELNDRYLPGLNGDPKYLNIRRAKLEEATRLYDQILKKRHEEKNIKHKTGGYVLQILPKIKNYFANRSDTKKLEAAVTIAFYPQEYFAPDAPLAEKLRAKKIRQDRLRLEGIIGIGGSQDVTLRLWTVGLASFANVPGLTTLLNIGMLATIDGMVQSFINAQQEVLAEGIAKPQPMSFGNGTMTARMREMKTLQMMIQAVITRLDDTQLTPEQSDALSQALKKMIAELQKLEMNYKGARYRLTALLKGQFWQNCVRTIWVPTIQVLVSITGARVDALIRSAVQTTVSIRDGINQARYNRTRHIVQPNNILDPKISELSNMPRKIGYEKTLAFVKKHNLLEIDEKDIDQLTTADLFNTDQMDNQQGRQRMPRLRVIQSILLEKLAEFQMNAQLLQNQIRGFELGCEAEMNELIEKNNKSKLKMPDDQLQPRINRIQKKYDQKIKGLLKKINQLSLSEFELQKQLGSIHQIITYNEKVFADMQNLRRINQAIQKIKSLESPSEHQKEELLELIFQEKQVKDQISVDVHELYSIDQNIQYKAAKIKAQKSRFFGLSLTKNNQKQAKAGQKNSEPYHLHQLLNAPAEKLVMIAGKYNLKRPNDGTSNALLLGLTGFLYSTFFVIEDFSKHDVLSRLDKISENWDFVEGQANPIDVAAKSGLSNLLLMSTFVPEFMFNVGLCFENIMKFGGSCYHQDFIKILIDKIKKDKELAEVNVMRLSLNISKVEQKIANIRILKEQTEQQGPTSTNLQKALNKREAKLIAKQKALQMNKDQLNQQIVKVDELIEALQAQAQNPESLVALLAKNKQAQQNQQNQQNQQSQQVQSLEQQTHAAQEKSEQSSREILNWFNHALGGLTGTIKSDHLGIKHELYQVEEIAEYLKNQNTALHEQPSLKKADANHRKKYELPAVPNKGFWGHFQELKTSVGAILGRPLGSRQAHAAHAVGQNLNPMIDLFTQPNQKLENVMNDIINASQNFEDEAMQQQRWAMYWHEMFKQIPPEQTRLQNILLYRLQKMQDTIQTLSELSEDKLGAEQKAFLIQARQSLDIFLAKPELAHFLIGVQKEVSLFVEKRDGPTYFLKDETQGKEVKLSLTSTAAYFASYNYQATNARPIRLNIISRSREWFRNNIYQRRFGLRATYHFITKRLIPTIIRSISVIASAIARRKMEKTQLLSLQKSMKDAATHLQEHQPGVWERLSPMERLYLEKGLDQA